MDKIKIELTHDELEYILYEVLFDKLAKSPPSVQLDIQFIVNDWRKQAVSQGWEDTFEKSLS